MRRSWSIFTSCWKSTVQKDHLVSNDIIFSSNTKFPTAVYVGSYVFNLNVNDSFLHLQQLKQFEISFVCKFFLNWFDSSPLSRRAKWGFFLYSWIFCTAQHNTTQVLLFLSFFCSLSFFKLFNLWCMGNDKKEDKFSDLLGNPS